MIRAYIAINLRNGDSVKYVRDVVNDSAGVGERYYQYEGPGYQELGMKHVSSYDDSGLRKDSTYYFTVNIDGGGDTEYSINTGSNTKFGHIVNLMNNQISGDGAEFFITREGDIRCVSTSRSASTSIALSAGSSGTDLFASLNGFDSFESAVNGEQYADLTSAGQIQSDYNSITSSLTGASTLNTLISFPESGGSTTTLIRKGSNESSGEIGRTFISIPAGAIDTVEVIENELTQEY